MQFFYKIRRIIILNCHKWISNIFWLLFCYARFKNYCFNFLPFRNLAPYKIFHWHDNARLFLGMLENNAAHVFIKTENNFNLMDNEERMNKLFYDALPKNCSKIVNSFSYYRKKILVFEYINGRTLKDFFFNPTPKIPLTFFFNELIVIIDALYRLKLIHRDITPSNLIIHYDNRDIPTNIKLIDFTFCVMAGDTYIDSKLGKDTLASLGKRLKPKKFLWDDAFSAFEILKEIETRTGQSFPPYRERFRKRIGRLTHKC